MAVLGRQAILQAIDDGLIAITPFNADHVGPASVVLTLGSTFRVFRKVHEVIEVRDHTDYRECTDKLEIPEGGHILIMPGETVLGITRERVRLGPGLCGWLEGRSRFARLGLMVHISAPFMGPGDRQSAGAGNEQLRSGSTGGGAGHADLSVHLSAHGW